MKEYNKPLLEVQNIEAEATILQTSPNSPFGDRNSGLGALIENN